MTYLVFEILVCLLLAALIGFVVGWLWARAVGRSRLKAVESGWHDRFGVLERERDELRQKADDALSSLEKEQQLGQQLKSQLAQGQTELKTAQQSISEMTKEGEALRQKSTEAEKSAAALTAERDRLAAERKELNAQISALNTDLEKHSHQLADLKSKAEAEHKAHLATLETLKSVNAELEERGRRLAAFSTEVENAKRAQSSLQTLVDQRAAAFSDQEQTIGSLKDRVAALHADLGKREQMILSKDKDLDALRVRIAELERDLAQRDARLQSASETLSTCHLDLTGLAQKSTVDRQEFSGVIDQLRERVGELAPALQAREAEIAKLTQQLADWEKRYENRVEELKTCEAAVAAGQKTPAKILLRRPDEVDDIKEIRGIGPVLEKVLNRLGIYLFRQIADFTPEDVEWVSSNLPEFPRRIIQERWIDQARELYAKKYGSR